MRDEASTTKHESEFANSFIVPQRKERWLDGLTSETKRSVLIACRLGDPRDLDPRFVEEVPRNQQTPELTFALLRKLGAPESCYCMSIALDLDRQTLPLLEALEQVVCNTVLSCVPGVLCYFEADMARGRFILRRNPVRRER